LKISSRRKPSFGPSVVI
jgi:hypothetical protein